MRHQIRYTPTAVFVETKSGKILSRMSRLGLSKSFIKKYSHKIASVDVMYEALIASRDSIGKWMSAALDDPKVCGEMKSDIRKFFEVTFSAIKSAEGKL